MSRAAVMQVRHNRAVGIAATLTCPTCPALPTRIKPLPQIAESYHDQIKNVTITPLDPQAYRYVWCSGQFTHREATL